MLSFTIPLCCVRLLNVIICDVRDTVMILYMICRLVCVTDSWAHMSIVHSILSLKLGVTLIVFAFTCITSEEVCSVLHIGCLVMLCFALLCNVPFSQFSWPGSLGNSDRYV